MVSPVSDANRKIFCVDFKRFYYPRRYASALYAVIVCPSARPPVCPSVHHKSKFYEDG